MLVPIDGSEPSKVAWVDGIKLSLQCRWNENVGTSKIEITWLYVIPELLALRGFLEAPKGYPWHSLFYLERILRSNIETIYQPR